MSTVIACIGAGTIGRAWAIAFARAGCSVRLCDRDASILAEAGRLVEASLQDLQHEKLVDDAAAIRKRIEYVADLRRAVDGVSYVQESIVERVDAKRELYTALATCIAADTLVGSSTSEIPGSRFMLDLPISARCLVVHPVNPPFLIPLVELCPTPATSHDAVARTTSLMTAIGQSPVLVRREIEGFLLNRLQAAVIAEGLHLIREGVCDPVDIDRTMRDGLGLRWTFLGPFETGHLNSAGGYGEYMGKYGELFRRLAKSLGTVHDWTDGDIAAIDQYLAKTVPPARVPARQRWRDRVLMRLRRLLVAERANSEW